MTVLAHRPPRTPMEVFKMLPEGTRAEVINGSLYMSPAPLFRHQDVLKKIAFALHRLVEENGLGSVVIAPFDVFLDEVSNAVQPDITVILKSNVGQIDGAFYGVPDLIVEVLSPGNQKHDTELKRDLYERTGVREYWIVNPDTCEVHILGLSKGRYETIAKDTGKIKSALLTAELVF